MKPLRVPEQIKGVSKENNSIFLKPSRTNIIFISDIGILRIHKSTIQQISYSIKILISIFKLMSVSTRHISHIMIFIPIS